MDNPLVSVIIIFYNEERFLDEAVQSVVRQRYSNWELLLADDGSTDSSPEIARSYEAARPGQIHYLQHPGRANRGMSATRNLGLDHAQGQYIAFLDADDVWLSNKLEEQVRIMERKPEAGMLYGRTVYWYSWHENPQKRDVMTALPPVSLDTLVQPPTMLNSFLGDFEVYPCMCSVIVRRETFEKVGRFEEAFRDANEDMVFHSKVFLHTPVYLASTCWDRYRQHPASYWARARANFSEDDIPNPAHEQYLNWLETYLQEQNIGTSSVHRALWRAQLPYRHPKLYRVSNFLHQLYERTSNGCRNLARRYMPDALYRLYKGRQS